MLFFVVSIFYAVGAVVNSMPVYDSCCQCTLNAIHTVMK